MKRAKKIAIRALTASAAFCLAAAALYALDLHRSRAEMGTVLTDIFSESVKARIDKSTPEKVQIVILGNAVKPGGGITPGQEVGLRSLWANTETTFPEASRASRIDFFLTNVVRTQIRADIRFPIGAEAAIVSEAEMDNMTHSDYEKRFPYSATRGVERFAFSQAGFNFAKTEAIIYGEVWCGGLCGGGEYLLLRKVDGHWKVVARHDTWVS